MLMSYWDQHPQMVCVCVLVGKGGAEDLSIQPEEQCLAPVLYVTVDQTVAHVWEKGSVHEVAVCVWRGGGNSDRTF